MKQKSISLASLKITLLISFALSSILSFSSIANAHEDQFACKHGHWDKEKVSEYFQKRQDELHEKLGLTNTQEVAWNKYIASIKPNETHKREDWSEVSNLTTPERLDRMLARTKEREIVIEKRVHATKEFYSQLNAAQQKTFDESFQHRQHHEHGNHDHKQEQEPS